MREHSGDQVVIDGQRPKLQIRLMEDSKHFAWQAARRLCKAVELRVADDLFGTRFTFSLNQCSGDPASCDFRHDAQARFVALSLACENLDRRDDADVGRAEKCRHRWDEFTEIRRNRVQNM